MGRGNPATGEKSSGRRGPGWCGSVLLDSWWSAGTRASGSSTSWADGADSRDTTNATAPSGHKHLPGGKGGEGSGPLCNAALPTLIAWTPSPRKRRLLSPCLGGLAQVWRCGFLARQPLRAPSSSNFSAASGRRFGELGGGLLSGWTASIGRRPEVQSTVSCGRRRSRLYRGSGGQAISCRLERSPGPSRGPSLLMVVTFIIPESMLESAHGATPD